MNDWEHVNFSQDHEMDYHLGLANKSKSKDNREFLRSNTQWTAKEELDKKVITHDDFKPFVNADKSNLADTA
jgi:hypothetical protein